MGNYSYVRRYQRVVPRTHRFVVAGDPVPKLPPLLPLGEFTLKGFQHVGVEILLDWRRASLVVGPNIVEHYLLHVSKNNLGTNHVMGAYVVTLMFWAGRVHGGRYVPDWWLIVVNHMMRAEPRRMQLLLSEFDDVVRHSFEDQTCKDGATTWDSQGRVLRHLATETPHVWEYGAVCGVCATPVNADAPVEKCPKCGAVTFVARSQDGDDVVGLV